MQRRVSCVKGPPERLRYGKNARSKNIRTVGPRPHSFMTISVEQSHSTLKLPRQRGIYPAMVLKQLAFWTPGHGQNGW